MRRKRNTFKTTKAKTSEKELNKSEISNLPLKEIKVIVISSPNSREEWMNTVRISTKRKILKKNQTEEYN